MEFALILKMLLGGAAIIKWSQCVGLLIPGHIFQTRFIVKFYKILIRYACAHAQIHTPPSQEVWRNIPKQ
jgi:hypothetical protein